MKFTYPFGATPLAPDEVYNLLPKHLTTQKELNEWEQFNILQAKQWLLKNPNKMSVSISFICMLHKKMFNKTWNWAGEYRKRQTNIGVESVYIPQELQLLCNDIQYWITHDTFPLLEIAVRLHHRFVLIHPFPNGNGRCARLLADMLLQQKSDLVLRWGAGDLNEDNAIRRNYIKALQEADAGDYGPLLSFVI